MTEKERLQSQVDFANNRQGDLKYYDCPICKNKGIEYFIKDDEMRIRDCSCMKHRKINMTIAKSGLAHDFERYTLDKFKTDKAHWKVMYDKAIKFLDKPAEAFYVAGQTGSGKTFICTAMSKIFIERGYDFKYLKYAESYPRLQRDLKNFKPDIAERAEKELRDISNVQVLYIDDFLKVGGYDNVFELINSRYGKGLITIISSETYLNDIQDEAIYGRIKQMSGEYVITISRDKNKNERTI